MKEGTLKQQLTGAAISLAILALGVVVFMKMTAKPERAAEAAATPAPALVQAVDIQPHSGQLDISVDGVVVPYREIPLAAEVGGRVVFKNEACRAGRYVDKGTRLLAIDRRDYEIAVSRLTSQVDQSTASLDEVEIDIQNNSDLIELAESQLDLDRREVKRLTDLGNAVTATDLDRARKAELVSRNALVMLKSQTQALKTRRRRLESAKAVFVADLDKAKLDLQRTEITAPVDGMIVVDHVEQDSYLQPGAPVLTLEDTSAVDVKCRLRMEELHWLWRHQASDEAVDENELAQLQYQVPETAVTVTYRLTGQPHVRYQWQGKLSRYDGIGLDESTRTVPCRVLVDSPREVEKICNDESGRSAVGPPALVRGMYVTVELHVDPPSELVRLPENAVRAGKSAWVIDDGRARLVQRLPLVELIETPAESGELTKYWLVEAGPKLTPGTQVIVPPFGVLSDGMPVAAEVGE